MRPRAVLTREPRHFGRWLVALAVLGLGVRLVYALVVAPTLNPRGDTLLYHFAANGIADGHGYATLASLIQGHPQPTSANPPLYPLYLSAFSLVGLDSLDAHRAVSCLLGAVAIVLIGLLGRRVAGPRAGLLAAGLAAVYPQLFMVDGTVIPESLYAPLIVGTLLVAYAFRDRPGVGRAAALGALIGLATLTRSEAIALLVLLALPLVVRLPRDRLKLLGVIVACTVVVLVPWVARNWAAQHQFIALSSNSGFTALATNCRPTYYDSRYIGFAYHDCAFRSRCIHEATETEQASCARSEAWAFTRRHVTRVPLVLAARVARIWEVYGYHTDLGYGELWSRQVTVAKAGLAFYGVLVVLAAIGVVLLRRRRVPLLPLLVPFALVTLVALTAFGFSRYRLAAEPSLVVLAAVALDAWMRRLRTI